MTQFIAILLILLACSSQAMADLRIKIRQEVMADSSELIPMNIHRTTEITIWVDTVSRCAAIDKEDGTHEIYVNKELYCTTSPDFETYRLGPPPDPRVQLANDTLGIAAGLDLVRPEPVITHAATGEQKEILGLPCAQYLVEIVMPGSDTIKGEVWATDALQFDRSLYGKAKETDISRVLGGFPMVMRMDMGSARARFEVLEFSEVEPPPYTYSIPEHFEFLPWKK